LGPNVYEKTQTQKYMQRRERKGASDYRPKTDYGIQMLEKQKARFTYGVSERQFKNYVMSILDAKGGNSPDALVSLLESRLDNAVYRIGLAPTRQAARQMVNHGHVMVNGRRMSIPSYKIEVGDVITLPERSVKKPLFASIDEKLSAKVLPAWISGNAAKKEWKIAGAPKVDMREVMFDAATVLQFYSR
jgi:small subunit ribosomal protein S4